MLPFDNEQHEKPLTRREAPVLEGLDTIGWECLTHAYGSAADVPELLRDLASDDEDRQYIAADTFYTNLWHQGAVAETAAYAVPFLVRLIQAPTTRPRIRHMLVDLLALFSVGEANTRAYAQYMAEEGRATPEFEEKVDRRLREDRAAHEAVGAEIPFLLKLLHDQDTELAAIAAHALSCFPERATQLAPELRASLDQELAVTVKASCILSLGVLAGNDAKYTQLYGDIIRSDAPGPLRLAAAMALARALRETAPDEAVQILTTAKDDPGWDEDVGPWLAADMRVDPAGPYMAMWRILSGQEDPTLVAGGLVPDYVCTT
jgi:hypothetical protein